MTEGSKCVLQQKTWMKKVLRTIYPESNSYSSKINTFVSFHILYLYPKTNVHTNSIHFAT